MKKKRLALVGAGPLGRSFVPKLPGLPDLLGPVIAPTLRVASRFVNSLRAGYPVQNYGDLAHCRTVLISVPDTDLPGMLADMAASEMDWTGKAVLLCDSSLDSAALSGLFALGASTGSLALLDAAGDGYVVEGGRDAVRQVRRLLRDRRMKLFELAPSGKPAYLAGRSLATSLFAPLLEAAVRCLRAAGMKPAPTAAVAERLFERTLRIHLHAGKRTRRNRLDAEHRWEMQLHARALEDVDPALAEYYRQTTALALRLLGESPHEAVRASAPPDSGLTGRRQGKML
jgi:hypothetical protein